MSRGWKREYDIPGLKGMASTADPRNLPDGFALNIQNAVFGKTIGALDKRSGFDLSTLSPVPVEMTKHLSTGFFTFTVINEVPGSNELVVNRMGRMFVQVNGIETQDENGLDWWWNEYDFDAGEWGGWNGPFTEEDILGGSGLRADKITWINTLDSIKGVCGNESDSTPIQMRYVSRLSRDDNGYFHDFTFIDTQSPTTGDADEFVGIVNSIDLPKITASVYFTGLHHGTVNASYQNETVRYMVVPVFDGHQVASPNQIIPYDPDELGYTYWNDRNMGFAGHQVATRLNIDINWDNDTTIQRLTGINLYESRASFQPVEGSLNIGFRNYPSWGLIREIDIRDGVFDSIYSYDGTYVEANLLRIAQTDIPNDSFNDLWVNIKSVFDDTTIINERYQITDVIQAFTGATTDLIFTASDSSALSLGETYNISIEEHWYDHPDQENAFRITLYLDGNKIPGTPPPWLPDPNALDDPNLKLPRISVNYKVAAFWENERRMVVANVYDKFAQQRFPLQFRISPAPLDEFPGHDILWDFVNVPGEVGDEIVGIAFSYDLMLILTKYRIITYTLQNNIVIPRDTIWNVGAISADSIDTWNGITRFLGRRGKYESLFRTNGIEKPADIGFPIQDNLKSAFAVEGIVKELSRGFIDEDANEYRLSINRYSA